MYSLPTSSSSAASGVSSATGVSAAIPLATYSPMHQAGSLAHASAFAASSSSFFPSPQTTAQMSAGRYDAYPAPTPLSTSSLEQGTVYRGVFHGSAEPTMFAAPSHQAQLWQSHARAEQPFHSAPSKKLELTELTYPTAYTATAYAPIAPQVDLAVVPSHVERFTSFYSAAVPAVIAKALRIGFQTISEMRADVEEEALKGKFRGQCFTEDNESIQFVTRVYKTGSAAPAPYLVEFQRRCGDSVSFFRFFQKMLKSCAAIHHGPYETSFAVAGMNIPPVLATPSFHPSGPLALPNMQALRLDLPSVSSLCSMVASDCIESKRESAKCLARVSQSSSLFPPTLERQVSSPSACAASAAIWSAVVTILTSGDSECARLGASILRNCLTRGDTEMLLEHLDADRAVVPHLVSRLSQEVPSEQMDAGAAREIRRQVAAVLTALVSKKGAAYISGLAPDAIHVLNYYNQQQ